MPRHGSLFSGIGGFDIAASWMGWQNIFSCEKDPFCRTVLKHYWPNTTPMKTSTIFRQLTFEDTSTSSAAGSPSSRLARPDGERGRKMTVTSSQGLSELLRKHGRSGSFLKTLLDCSPFSNPIVFLKWKSKRLSFFVR